MTSHRIGDHPETKFSPSPVDCGDADTRPLATAGQPVPNEGAPVSGSISRRTLMKSISIASISALGSTIAVAAPGEDAATKVDRLMKELSDALSEHQGGAFRAVVEPSSKPQCQVLLEDLAASPSGDPELMKLIQTHMAAWRALEGVCDLADKCSPQYDAENGPALWAWHNDAESEAAHALLAYPARTVDDIRIKAGYLLKARQTTVVLDDRSDIETFLQSLVVANDTKLAGAIEWIDGMQADGWACVCHGDSDDPNSYGFIKNGDDIQDRSRSLKVAVIGKALPIPTSA